MPHALMNEVALSPYLHYLSPILLPFLSPFLSMIIPGSTSTSILCYEPQRAVLKPPRILLRSCLGVVVMR
jgi:hypothetical protein